MHVALGYRWHPEAAGFHLERALTAAGHTVTYVGLPSARRPGYAATTPITEIVAALPHPPEVYWWVDSSGGYFPPGIEDLPLPTVAWLTDVHLGRWREQAAGFFDVVFLAQRAYLDTYRRVLGHRQVHWLPLAAAPDVHRRHGTAKVYDVGFVGSVARAHRGTGRARRLRLLADRFTTNDFGRYHTAEEAARVYSQSRIAFNTSIAGDVTMRVFEATACGALLVTDAAATVNGLGELFGVGTEIVTYRDDAELLETVAFYLAHDAEREAVAAAGRRRTLAEHRYTDRAAQVIETVQARASRRAAPLRQASQTRRDAARRQVYIHLHLVDALLDAARAQGRSPAGRLRAVWPALARRLVL